MYLVFNKTTVRYAYRQSFEQAKELADYLRKHGKCAEVIHTNKETGKSEVVY